MSYFDYQNINKRDNMKRITKAKARKLFNEGQAVTIIPHKVRTDNVWGIGMEIQKGVICNTIHNQTYCIQGFDWWLDCYITYNCNFENGYYCAYYINEDSNNDK